MLNTAVECDDLTQVCSIPLVLATRIGDFFAALGIPRWRPSFAAAAH